MTTSASPAPPTPWILDGHAARLPSGRIDLADPAAGLRLGPPAHDAILALDAAGGTARLQPADVWVRGDDLTAVYEPADERRLRATMTWRPGRATGDDAAWEAIVSAQTARITSDPRVAIVADAADGAPLWGRLDGATIRWTADRPAAPVCLLLRRPADALVVAVHPEAEHQLAIETGGARTRIICRLFPQPVEKGVLLRARVLTARTTSPDPTAAAERLLHAFLSSPPILTT